MKQAKLDICYLCGKLLSDTERDDDHVPPKHLYSQEIRSSQNLSHLLTLPTHKACNASFQMDEQYFIHTFIPLAVGSAAGTSLWNEIRNQYAKGKNIPLRMKALAEFQPRPSGLVLPYGKIAKHFDPQRVWRVAWKITRGLFYHEFHVVLPEETLRGFSLVAPDERPPNEFSVLAPKPGRGQYPKVFDYKYAKLEDPQVPDVLYIWAMLFWDRLIMLIYFHDLTCKCGQCAR